MSGRLHDAGVEVALARIQLRQSGHTRESAEAMLTEDVFMEAAATEAVAAKAADDARIGAWFQRAAKESTVVRMQPLPEVPDG